VTGWTGDGLAILDFDIENRPLSYLGSDYTTGEVTAIAWQVVGKPRTADCVVLGVSCQHPGCDDVHCGETLEEVLSRFVAAYDEADMVTGHYIRGHDLPVLNGALLELGRAPLGDKLTHDTKNDLVNRKYLSASQENLGATLGLRAPKVKMDQAKWREANRLTPEGVELTKKRVVGDVRQHIELRQRLLEIGALRPPVMWSGRASKSTRYTP
jgi:hypothetical protein